MVRKQDLDHRQLSIFDNDDDSYYEKQGYLIIRFEEPEDPRFRSKKPVLKFKVRGYSYHEAVGPDAIVYAVSRAQAKRKYDDKTGNWFKYGHEIAQLVE